MAYQTVHLDNDLQARLNVKAHDIRALAASWAAIAGTVSLQQILEACTWKSPNSFISYYSADQAFENEGSYRLPPFMAANAFVDPRTLRNKAISKN